MFRDAFRRNRCLISASGYYEWLKTSTGKQPHYYTARDGAPLTMAGLWDEWKYTETGINVLSWHDDCHERQRAGGPGALPYAGAVATGHVFSRWLAGTAGAEMLKPAR